MDSLNAPMAVHAVSFPLDNMAAAPFPMLSVAVMELIVDVSVGTCSKGAEKIAWLEKAIATVKSVVCPDGQSVCPDGSTCCKLSTGHYGCCPLPKAVCCSDGSHCCPSGYTCDVSAGTCSKGTVKIPWMKKTGVKVLAARRIHCPDEKWSCETGTTCCKMSDGAYGCCPTSNVSQILLYSLICFQYLKFSCELS
jgi:hypothetical protein